MIVIGLLLLSAVESVDWYAKNGLTVTEREALTEKQCYRGTYGPDHFSLLTCDFEQSQLIASSFPEHTPLCVVELARSSDMDFATDLATRSNDVIVVHRDLISFVLAPTDASMKDYPNPCIFIETYSGLALNVITVPTVPIAPQRRFKLPEVSAPDPTIELILAAITSDNLEKKVNQLSDWWSRLSTSAPSYQASESARLNFSQSGWEAETQSFRSDYCPNVVATKLGTGDPNKQVVIGAHLDCRQQNTANVDPVLRAPGADDNGTGSAAVLELARVINQLKATFQYTIKLLLFCGEEQGLVGSNAYAQKAKADGDQIELMVNMDMLGWNQGGATRLGFMGRSASQDASTQCANIARQYLVGLQTGTTQACCSDQQSFFNAGFTSIGLFEGTANSVQYPCYHMITDTGYSNGTNGCNLDWDQVALFAQAGIACALTAAMPNPIPSH